MNSFLVRLQPVGGDLFLATPIDTAAHPEHPIVYPPPGGPPGIWPGPGPLPGIEHPIVLPGDPSWEPPKPIDPPPGGPPDAPPQNCKWVYTAKGWVLVCGPYDKPRPPGSESPKPTPR